MRVDRRKFLIGSAAAAGSLRTFAQTSPSTATLKIHADQPLADVPANFIGLSYEIEELTDPTFFASSNTALIAAFKQIAPHGVLRLGGNTSDVGWWKDSPTATEPDVEFRTAGVGEPGRKQMFALEPAAITALRGFLDSTGWTCIFGINLGTQTPEQSAREAEFVARTLGDKLLYFQVGNEPDLLSRHLRDPKTWNADAYFDEWLRTANAIRARVPGARFGLPDTAGNPEWYAVVVKRLSALEPAKRPEVAALSHHYYTGGPPSNPKVTVDSILSHNSKVDTLAHDIRSASDDLSKVEGRPIAYRMSEGNSCYGGGKPGVSDVFAAALWAADYCLALAAYGYSGVNLHGGTRRVIANGLGGVLPGDILRGDTSGTHAPYYTPIASITTASTLEPVAFGLQFAQQFAGTEFVKVDFDSGGVNASAYAAIPRGDSGYAMQIAVINKDAASAITLPFGKDAIGVKLHRMMSASLDAHDVRWTVEEQRTRDIVIPPASAVFFGLSGYVL